MKYLKVFSSLQGFIGANLPMPTVSLIKNQYGCQQVMADSSTATVHRTFIDDNGNPKELIINIGNGNAKIVDPSAGPVTTNIKLRVIQ